MRAVSRKRAREQRVYASLRAKFLEANPLCAMPECGRPAEEIHHKRGRVGRLYLAVEHWTAMCHDDHTFLTEHPAEAIALGLSESRFAS